METYLVAMLLFPLVGAALNGVFGRRFSRHAHWVALVGMGGAWVFAVLSALQFSGTPVHVVLFPWLTVGDLNLHVGFYYDALTLVMTLTVTTVAFLIHVYSVGYMHGDPGYARFFAALNLFVFAMLLLVTADSYLLTFVGWEGVGLCSYLLIGHEYHRKAAADAALKAFVVNRVGDAGFILGMFLLFGITGTLVYPEVFEGLHHLSAFPALLPLVGFLFFLGATGKSAQIPLYVWLPDAMEGPTPVSALIHAATMVTAGVYLIARSAPLYDLIPQVGHFIAWVGGLTAIMAAFYALTQRDLKRILAYSTISQLGYMFLAVGLGAYAAGIFHLFTHAFFKALLFLGAGSVMHATGGVLDIFRMGGLRKKMPHTYWTFLIASLALAGIPPLAGFFSKDEILKAAFGLDTGLWWIGTVTALMTAFYMFRAVVVAFHGTPRDPEVYDHVHESPPVMTLPLWALAVGTMVVGFLAGPFHRFLHDLSHRSLPEIHALPVLAASILAAVLGIALAYQIYQLQSPSGEVLARKFRWLWVLSYRKLFVDEIYDVLVRRTFKGLALGMYYGGDWGVIDGTVHFTAWLQKGMGAVLARFQNGLVRAYVVWTLVVLAYILWVVR